MMDLMPTSLLLTYKGWLTCRGKRKNKQTTQHVRYVVDWEEASGRL